MGTEPIMAGMPYNQRDTDTGQFSPTFSEQEVMNAVEQANDATTTEIAEIVGCAYRTAYQYLRRLEADDTVSRRKLGTTSIWELSGEVSNGD